MRVIRPCAAVLVAVILTIPVLLAALISGPVRREQLRYRLGKLCAIGGMA